MRRPDRQKANHSPRLTTNPLQKGQTVEAAGIEPAEDSPRLMDPARVHRGPLELRELLAASAVETDGCISVTPRLWSAILELAEGAERTVLELLPSDFRTGSRQPVPLEQAISGLRIVTRFDLAA